MCFGKYRLSVVLSYRDSCVSWRHIMSDFFVNCLMCLIMRLCLRYCAVRIDLYVDDSEFRLYVVIE